MTAKSLLCGAQSLYRSDARAQPLRALLLAIYPKYLAGINAHAMISHWCY